MATTEKRPFVFWGGKDVPSNGFTGVITYRRANGSRLCESERYNGNHWGCSRYYNAQDQYLGQEWYGKPGYNDKSMAYASGGVVVLEAWVDQDEYQKVYDSTMGNYQDQKRTKMNYEFVNAEGHWAGVEVFLGENGRPLVEQEMKDGAKFGCRRYYNHNGKLVGQEIYGGIDWAGKNGGKHICFVDSSASAMRKTPSPGPLLARYMNQEEFDQVKKEFTAALAEGFSEVEEAEPEPETVLAVGEVEKEKSAPKTMAAPTPETSASPSPCKVEEPKSASAEVTATSKPALMDKSKPEGKDSMSENTDIDFLSKQIATLMKRQNLHSKRLEEEQEQRESLQQQLHKERKERQELGWKLQELDSHCEGLKSQLTEKQHENKPAKPDQEIYDQLNKQLEVQHKLIEEQNDQLQAAQKQLGKQQIVIENLGERLEEERKERQVQQIEINNFRAELSQMKATQEQKLQDQTEANNLRLDKAELRINALEDHAESNGGQTADRAALGGENVELAVESLPEKEIDDEVDFEESGVFSVRDDLGVCENVNFVEEDSYGDVFASSDSNLIAESNGVETGEHAAASLGLPEKESDDEEDFEESRVFSVRDDLHGSQHVIFVDEDLYGINEDTANDVVAGPNVVKTAEHTDIATDSLPEKESDEEDDFEESGVFSVRGDFHGSQNVNFVDEDVYSNIENAANDANVVENTPTEGVANVNSSETAETGLSEDAEGSGVEQVSEPPSEPVGEPTMPFDSVDATPNSDDMVCGKDSHRQCDPSRCHHARSAGLIVEDPLPRPRSQRRSSKRNSILNRSLKWHPASSFKLGRHKKGKNAPASSRAAAPPSKGVDHMDDPDVSYSDYSFDERASSSSSRSKGEPKQQRDGGVTSSNHTDDEPEPQPEINPEPSTEPELEREPSDELTDTAEGAGQTEELVENGDSESSIPQDQTEASQEIVSVPIVEDPKPRRRSTRGRKSILKSWNPGASLSQLIH